MTEYERVRGEVADWIPAEEENFRLEVADLILAIEGICVKADDQDLPEYGDYYPTTTFTPRYQQARWASWSKGQLQMLKAGFVKVINNAK